jgi:hypothetical protein
MSVLTKAFHFQDEFWCLFLNLWVIGVGLIYNLTLYFLPGRKPMHYYVCANLDPMPDFKLAKKSGKRSSKNLLIYNLNLTSLYILGLIDTFSLILHIIVKARILYYKHKKGQNFPKHSNHHSLMDFATQGFSLCLIFSFLALQLKVSTLTIDDLNQFPNYLYMYSLLFIGPNSICLIVSVLHYMRNSTMRVALFNEMKEQLSIC